MSSADLIFDTLDPHDDTGRNAELFTGWGEAAFRGFHEPRMNAEMRALLLESTRADRAVLRGAWQREPVLGSGLVPVATYGSLDKTLNVGAGRLLPLRMVTDVTVSPTHRRRGLLRRLITEDLTDAVARGVPVAALTASEGSIYGRFGFGPATSLRRLLVRTDQRFALRSPADGGSVELVEPAEAWPTVEALYARHHATTRGSVGRPHFYQAILTARFDWDERSPDHKLRTAVHLDADGNPDGYVAYKHAGEVDGRSTMQVVDLVALTDRAHLRLWRFLADLDLVEQVRFDKASVVDPLEWALVEPRVVRTDRLGDHLWVRVLDVVVALEARPWSADGDVVVEVDDPLGHAAGRWRVVTSAGSAQVNRVDDAPDVRLSVDTLGALYLGGVAVATLAAAGRVGGDDAAVAALAAMADGGPAPYCNTGF